MHMASFSFYDVMYPYYDVLMFVCLYLITMVPNWHFLQHCIYQNWVMKIDFESASNPLVGFVNYYQYI